MLRMLAVDDDRVVQRYLTALLAPHGRVDLAADGDEAVACVRRAREAGAPYDLVVMDIMMPGLDGLSATLAIREQERAQGARPVRIVVLSCLGDPEHMLRAQYECGADAYLTKPLEAATLAESLAGLGLAANPLDALDELDELDEPDGPDDPARRAEGTAAP
ncbi:MAG: response regulator [Desulfovibrionaceae bacterium]